MVQLFDQPWWFWRAVLLRSAGFWAAARVLLLPLQAALQSMLGPVAGGRHPIELAPLASVVLVLIVGVLVQVHMRALKERVFLANMGVGRLGVMAPTCVAAILELSARSIIGVAVG